MSDGKECGDSVKEFPHWALLVGAFGIGAAGLWAYLRGKNGEFVAERLGQRFDAIEQISAALLDVLSEEGWSKSRGAVVAASLMGILEIARGSAAEVKKLTEDVAKLRSVRAKLLEADEYLEDARDILLEVKDIAKKKKRVPKALSERADGLADKLTERKLKAFVKEKLAREAETAVHEPPVGAE
jgi:hypothetical protein